MTGPEDFLSRWSRRKRAEEEARERPAGEKPLAEPAAAKEIAPDDSEKSAAKTGTTAAAKPEPEFDLSSLPSIESIGADTDIRPFLRTGVPEELRRAALRRAWAADPAIRDYIGPSENSWDFNAPGSMYGFDPSNPEFDVQKAVRELFGGASKPPEEKSAPETTKAAQPEGRVAGHEPAGAAVQPDHELVKSAPVSATELVTGVTEQGISRVEQTDRVSEQTLDAPRKENIAPQQGDGTGRRRHGRALPS